MSRRINKRHNRPVLAARAAASAQPRPVLAPSTDLRARFTPVTAGGNVRNRKAVKMTAAQRDSTGARSAWSASPYYFTDPKLDQTVSSQHVGNGGFR